MRRSAGQNQYRRDDRQDRTKSDGALISFGKYMHPCTNEGYKVAVMENICHKLVPRFNAPIFSERGTEIGIVDEVFGPLNKHYFTVKLGSGIASNSLKVGEVFQIHEGRTLPLERFTTPQAPPVRQQKKPGRAGPIGQARRSSTSRPAPNTFKRDGASRGGQQSDNRQRRDSRTTFQRDSGSSWQRPSQTQGRTQNRFSRQ